MDQPLALFIYYQLPTGPIDSALRDAVEAMHADLRSQFPGLRTALYGRSDTTPVTWMETYHHDDGVPAALQESIEAWTRGWPADWQVKRHVELFALLSSCHLVD